MKMLAMIAVAVTLGSAGAGTAIPATAAEVQDQASEIKEDAKDKARDASERLKSTGRKVKQKAVEVKDKVKEKVQGGRETAGSERVRSAQQALRDRGFNAGPTDGVMGRRTRAAVTDFQKKEGLPTTGQLDTATMSRLGMEATTGAAEPSASSASPATGADKPQRRPVP